MNQNTFDVHGVSVQVNTPLKQFHDFIEHNYSVFHTHTPYVTTPDIDIIYSESSGEYAASKKSKLQYFGGGIYIGDRSIYWENEYDFRVLISICDNEIVNVHAFHHDLIGKSDSEERLKDFQRSMRWAIHFPLFTRLQYQRGWSLVHSSAVVKDGKAIMLCGLNGVGKSTLSVYMNQTCGYDLLTDNFLLVGDDVVYGFPEVVRLSPQAADRMEVESIWDDLVYGKHHVAPEAVGTELQATPEAFFFLTQGSGPETQRVDSVTTWETMQNLHSYLGEFPEHSYLGMWPYITGQTMNTETATQTITDTPWYELRYEPNWELDAVVGEVESCI